MKKVALGTSYAFHKKLHIYKTHIYMIYTYRIRSISLCRFCNKPNFWSRVIEASIPAFISSSDSDTWYGMSEEGEHMVLCSLMFGEGDLKISSGSIGDEDIVKCDVRSSNTSFILFVIRFTERLDRVLSLLSCSKL